MWPFWPLPFQLDLKHRSDSIIAAGSQLNILTGCHFSIQKNGNPSFKNAKCRNVFLFFPKTISGSLKTSRAFNELPNAPPNFSPLSLAPQEVSQQEPRRAEEPQPRAGPEPPQGPRPGAGQRARQRQGERQEQREDRQKEVN